MGFEVDDLYSLPESAKSRVLPTTVPYNYKRLWHFPTETTAPKSHKIDNTRFPDNAPLTVINIQRAPWTPPKTPSSSSRLPESLAEPVCPLAPCLPFLFDDQPLALVAA